MKKLFALFAAVLLLAGCTPTPKTVVESYYSALDKGEITEASKLLSSQVTAMAGAEKVRAGLQNDAERIQKKGGIASMTVEGEAKGELGMFQAHIKYKDGSTSDKEVKVTKEADGWKITP
jgi:hypothetical protein